MKKALLALAILALAAPIFAAEGYVGIYTDTGHSNCSVNYPQPTDQRYLYVFWFAPVVGFQAVEFRLELSDIDLLELGAVTHNPDSNLQLGDVESGIAVAFQTCYVNQWQWSERVRFYLYDTYPGYIYLRGFPGASHDIAWCAPGYEGSMSEAAILNHLAINQPCEVATESESWGAIKSMF